MEESLFCLSKWAKIDDSFLRSSFKLREWWKRHRRLCKESRSADPRSLSRKKNDSTIAARHDCDCTRPSLFLEEEGETVERGVTTHTNEMASHRSQDSFHEHLHGSPFLETSDAVLKEAKVMWMSCTTSE